MSSITISARLDKKGSETLRYNHFVFGRLGTDLSGGFYLNKNIVLPDKIVIELPVEKEGEKDA